MYIVRTYECTSQIKKNFTQMVQNYSELYLAVPPPTSSHCRLPPEMDGPGILICTVFVSPAGGSKILKSSIPEDSNPNGSGNPVKVTLRLSSSCGEGCTYRMLQSGVSHSR
jgi:hypothetical protein